MEATTLLAAVRAIHFGAVIVLFGQFAYPWLVAPDREAAPRFSLAAGLSTLLILLTAIAWLALEAIGMSGLPPAEALTGPTVAVVVTQTLFGRVWLFRLALASAIAVALVRLRDRRRGAVAFALAGAASALLLVSLAWCGHAAGGKGVDGAVHLCADVLHLLAAGAWLGALTPLIAVLISDEALAAGAARRFSALGIAAVCAILLSGIVNAAYTVADFSTVLSTPYGELLAGKVLLFLLIVILAAVNRLVLTPRLSLRALRRNAIVECLLGFCIIAIVGELGITVPTAHHH